MTGTELASTGALFLATAFQATFGFGLATMAVPLLSLMLPVEVAAPVTVLCSITTALLTVSQDWRRIHIGSAGKLLLAAAAGIPLGLVILKSLPAPVAKAILGVVVVSFCVYAGMNHHKHELKDDRFAWAFGFVAGVLGGSFGVHGPPLAVYGSLRRWGPQHFRATLQGYFLPAGLVGMAGYWLAGLWTPTVTRYYLLALPGLVAANLLGRMINIRLNAGLFLRWVYAGLAGAGLMLVVQAAWRGGLNGK